MLKLADNLTLPIEAVTQTFALLARRGAGKTHTASVLAEEMLSAGHCIVWLDPIGVAWGIRSHFPVAIFGGEHQDVPLEPTSGKIVAEFLVEKRVPALLDLSSFGENEMRRFVGDFCQRFYERNRQPVHVFIDEADEFAPQSASGGEIAKCLGAMQNLVRRGRARGIGVTLITQRSAVLNKSVLTQTECLIAMQTTAPHDLKAIEEWVKYHGTAEQCRDLIASLPKLQQGEAWVYSPGWLNRLERVKFRPRKSFDSSRTPKPGEKAKAPSTIADVDLPALTREIQSSIDRAKADDPKELRRQIAELKKQLGAKPAAATDPGVIERAIRRAIGHERQQHAREINERDGVIASLKSRMGKAESRLGEVAGLLHVNGKDVVPAIRQPKTPRKATTADIPKSSPQIHSHGKIITKTPSSITDSPEIITELGKAERAILTAFYWLHDQEATPSLVSFYSGYASSSSTWDRALGRLRREHVSGWRITQQGIEVVESWGVRPKPNGQQLREWLRPKLDRADNAMLDALIAAYPNRMSSEELSAASGYATSSSTWDRAIGRLRSLKAAEGYERDGGVKAADVFFEHG